MADKKRRGRIESASNSGNKSKPNHWKNRKRGGNMGGNKRRKTGPRLPNSLRKELERMNPDDEFNGEYQSDEETSPDDERKDLYEYEEGVPEEESRKNRRFDPVENYEYELPPEFEDEDVFSDDGENDDGADDDDDNRHTRMLVGVTGMPSEAFQGKKRNDIVVTEACEESEYNPTLGDAGVSMDDLLGSLQDKKDYSDLRRRNQEIGKKSVRTLRAPLPETVRGKLERRAVYDESKELISRWEPLVKRNREAPTIIFDKDKDMGFSTAEAIATQFEPRTDFEKKMASVVYNDKIIEAHKEDGAKLLELNKISVEDYRKNRDRIAKMNSLLFHHEQKMKRIKKIKSKTYHRIQKRDRLKGVSAEMQMDPEAVKELEMKQDFERAKERLTLRHKNQSKWVKRALQRGVQDEGTREAIADQLHMHELLTRKNFMKDSSSSDDSSNEEDDEGTLSSDQDGASRVLLKAKEKTLKVLGEEGEVQEQEQRLLSLPFMVRGMKKRQEAAAEEAKQALQDYESALKQLEGEGGREDKKRGIASGRRVFGAPAKQITAPKKKIRRDYTSSNSGSEDELETQEDADVDWGGTNNVQKDVNVSSALLNEDFENHQDSMFQSFDDIVKKPGPKTTYEVSMFASGTFRKMKNQDEVDTNIKKSLQVAEPVSQSQGLEEVGEESDTDSEGRMVDGILSSGPKVSYEDSQADIIREAFAADDVEDEFTRDKEELLNEENPEPEKPDMLPGWGQWTHVQKKRGLPSWMLKEHEIAKRKREESLKKRKDAHLKNVIISEKSDKKSDKLYIKTLPFPFKSEEAFEQDSRMPIGPEFNPATAVSALNRPEVVKKPGVIIKPIKFDGVDPFDKAKEHKQEGKQKEEKRRKEQKPGINTSRRKLLKPVVAKS